MKLLLFFFYTDENIGTYLKRDLYFGFMDFFQDFMESCDFPRKFGTIPVRVRMLKIKKHFGFSDIDFIWFCLQFNDPVYGPRNPNFTDFAAPGIILT